MSMSFRCRFVLGVAGAILASGRSVAQAPDSVLALADATVIDGTGRPAQPHMTVLIRGRRIEAVFARGARAIPAGARVLDLAGRYLIPGLIDAHVHLGTQQRPPGVMEAILRAVFLSGVTAVRDMGGSLRTVQPLATRARADSTPMPRVYYAAILAGPGRWFT